MQTNRSRRGILLVLLTGAATLLPGCTSQLPAGQTSTPPSMVHHPSPTRTAQPPAGQTPSPPPQVTTIEPEQATTSAEVPDTVEPAVGAYPQPATSTAGTLAEAPATLSAALPGTAEGFELVGHTALDSIGWHAGLALQGPCAYVGNRRSGALNIVDIGDPAAPVAVGTISLGEEAQPVELRTIPQRNLLVVSDFGNQRLLTFDVADCAQPRQLSVIDLGGAPHEFYLWSDGERVLLYGAMFDQSDSDLIVVDVTDAARPQVVTRWSAVETGIEGLLHSISVSPDGQRAYLAMWSGGVFVADVALPDIRPLRDESGAVRPAAFVAAHSVTPLGDADDPDYLLVTPELWRCPFGGVAIVSVVDVAHPHLVATVNLPENRCEDLPHPDAVFNPHNPLVVGDLVFVSWYSAGLQALDVSDPLAPERVAQFVPSGEGSAPQSYIGAYPVQTWSYPILHDGLLYVVDIQSGLYVLRYTGPGAGAVASVARAEGNVSILP